MDPNTSDSSNTGTAAASSSEVKSSLVLRWFNTSDKWVSFEGVLTVDNFTAPRKKCPLGECLTTVDFVIPNCLDIKWEIAVFRRGAGIIKGTKDHISIRVYRFQGGPQHLWKSSAISLINFLGQKCLRRQLPPSNAPTHPFARQFVGLRLDEKKARELLSDDKLTIAFEICIVQDAVNDHSYVHQRVEEHVDLFQDFGSMLNDQKFSDIVFKVDGHQFRGHKNILAARSPVFSAMFGSNLTESQDGLVTITDVSSEVFEVMLQFIYTDKVPCIKEVAAEVLAAADKYDLKKLKALAQTELCSDFSTENVCDLLSVAHIYNASYLKKRALQFITTNATAIVKTEGWRSLVEHYPKLGAEAFENLVLRK